MNILLLSAYLVLNTFNSTAPGDVYICNNKKTKKYHHSATCKGLSTCQFKIVKISAKVAKSKEMTLCGWESKKKK